MVEPITLKESLKTRTILESGKRKLMLYHNDPDGITSAALIMKFFSGFDAVPRKGPMMDDDFVNTIISKKPDTIVVLDIPIDQEYQKLKQILKTLPGTRVVVIDHHIIEKNLNAIGIIHINPRFKKKNAYMPCACIVYTMLSKLHFPVRHLVWMAGIGIISDYGIDDCSEVIDECKIEYPYLVKGNLRKSRLFDAAKLISSAVTLKGLKGASEALKILRNCEYFEDLAKIKKLREWRSLVDEEIRNIIAGFYKSLTKKQDVVFYKIETRLKLNSIIATILSEKHPDLVIVVRQRYKNGWKVSLRNQSGKYNLGDITKQAVKGIGSGGGHEKAAAAVVSKWLLFRRRLLEEIIKQPSA